LGVRTSGTLFQKGAAHKRTNPLYTALSFPSLNTVSQIFVGLERFFEVLAEKGLV
jgi:hypothetical protein